MIDAASGELWIPNTIKFSGPNSSSTTNRPRSALKRLHDVHIIASRTSTDLNTGIRIEQSKY